MQLEGSKENKTKVKTMEHAGEHAGEHGVLTLQVRGISSDIIALHPLALSL